MVLMGICPTLTSVDRLRFQYCTDIQASLDIHTTHPWLAVGYAIESEQAVHHLWPDRLSWNEKVV